MDEILQKYKTQILQYKYWLKNCLWGKKISSKSKEYIVSLTTYPKRIEKAYITIESLFDKNYSDYSVILWLSKEEFKENGIPSSLLRLEERGLEIRYVEGNIKSYKKLIYALKEFPNSKIITADDDVIYPKSWLANLVKEHQKFPHTIICYRGHDLKLNKKGELVSYNEILKSHKKTNLNTEPSYKLMPTGVSGVLYPPNCFDEKVFDKQLFLKLCPTGDDIWFKACSLLNNTKCKRVSESNHHFPIILRSQEFSLFQINVLQNQNNVQIGKAFKEFSMLEDLIIKDI